MSKSAYVYILASGRRGTLYTGVTSNLAQRMHQHRQHSLEGFTSKYGVTRLVWYLHGEDIAGAIALHAARLNPRSFSNVANPIAAKATPTRPAACAIALSESAF